MLIEVTQDDIEMGVGGDSAECPIARTLTRMGLPNPEVDEYEISYGERTYSELPEAVREFIRSFDEGQDVKPLTFTLDDENYETRTVWDDGDDWFDDDEEIDDDEAFDDDDEWDEDDDEDF